MRVRRPAKLGIELMGVPGGEQALLHQVFNPNNVLQAARGNRASRSNPSRL